MPYWFDWFKDSSLLSFTLVDILRIHGRDDLQIGMMPNPDQPHNGLDDLYILVFLNL